MTKEAVIIANGVYPSHEIPLSILKNASFLICCDGAMDSLSLNSIEPDIIIGDLDTISDHLKELYKEKIIEISDQETNDLTKAVTWAVNNNFTSVKIIGATGKREDHTIGNISLLLNYNEIIEAEMISDYGTWKAYNSPGLIDSFKGQQISIFSTKPDLRISSKNLKYPLHKLKLENWWMGTLNESLSSSFSLKFIGEIILFQKFED